MGQTVILPDLVMPSCVNKQWQYSGIDSLAKCRDKRYFLQYPHKIEYVYNSRGFRDQEWPLSESDLRDAIWCIGDSFTVGIGQPTGHIWPVLASKALGRRTINISMDGASNQWMSRRAKDIATTIRPRNIIIMWSYLHRRESSDTTLPDEQRKLHFTDTTPQQDLDDLKSCLQTVTSQQQSKITNFIIPKAYEDGPGHCMAWQNLRGPDWPLECPADIANIPDFVRVELESKFQAMAAIQEYQSELASWLDIFVTFDRYGVEEVPYLDLARDGHHFDRITGQWIVDRLLERIDL